MVRTVSSACFHSRALGGVLDVASDCLSTLFLEHHVIAAYENINFLNLTRWEFLIFCFSSDFVRCLREL